jgi:hypothetical protein
MAASFVTPALEFQERLLGGAGWFVTIHVFPFDWRAVCGAPGLRSKKKNQKKHITNCAKSFVTGEGG